MWLESELVHMNGDQAQVLIEAEGISKGYRSQAAARSLAIGELSLSVAAQEFVAILGPSGCGKTTLLRCLSGLLKPDSGKVRFAGSELSGVPSGLGLVFQEYNRSLFPWMSVGRNIGFGLRNMPRAERKATIADALNRVGLLDVADFYPWQLSGGMQQRVAIARALASSPRCVLMDEPFASVDAQTRESLEDMTLGIWAHLGLTVVLVTHDIDEAIYMANRVVVLTSRPSRVAGEVVIDLPMPRQQLETRGADLFHQYRKELHALLRGESAASSTAA
jgi:NitT/TauT family transport system ATP-binding protein